jgi:hypothetical protein
MTTRADFLARVERHLDASGETPTAFGRRAANDPNFVFDLRDGRSVGLDMVERVLACIEESGAGKLKARKPRAA